MKSFCVGDDGTSSEKRPWFPCTAVVTAVSKYVVPEIPCRTDAMRKPCAGASKVLPQSLRSWLGARALFMTVPLMVTRPAAAAHESPSALSTQPLAQLEVTQLPPWQVRSVVMPMHSVVPSTQLPESAHLAIPSTT